MMKTETVENCCYVSAETVTIRAVEVFSPNRDAHVESMCHASALAPAARGD